MAASRSNPINLAKGESFSIDLVIRDEYTHSIQLSKQNGEVLVLLPLDPTDNTLAGTIKKEALKSLGEEEEVALKLLSGKLLEHIGAKEFILVPSDVTLPGYTTPENSGFSRFRHGERDAFLKSTASVLEKNKDLAAELDRNYFFISSEESLIANTDALQRYQELNNILEKARFLDSKMAEFKSEELQGKMSRFKSEHVRPIVMLDKKGNVCGLVRALEMGNGFTYLSDEVVNQEILALDKFAGATESEKKSNRETFLLAYLINHACKRLIFQNHLFIIAANGREGIYDAIGCKPFPLELEGWKAMMKFGPRGALLNERQAQIRQLSLPLSQAAKAAHADEQKAAPSVAAMISASRGYVDPNAEVGNKEKVNANEKAAAPTLK